ncbi:MAG: guanylate kinase [bacterium]
MNQRGLLVVISAPSGGGKTTILRRVLQSGNGNFRYSVSTTTRARRRGEIEGRDYHFVSTNEFQRRRDNGEFIEWAEVHGHYYATPREPIERWLDEGRLILTDLDVVGGLTIKEQYGDSALLIFVKPPSFQSLIQRLKSRNTETPAEIEKRLERYPDEIEKSKFYDYQCVNDDLKQTIQSLLKIINQHYCVY